MNLRTQFIAPVALLAALLAACASTDSRPTAADGWQAGVERDPEAATLHAMARLHAAQGRDEEAEVALRHLLAREPGFLPAWEELARLYLKRGLLDGAVTALELGLERAPRDPVLLNDLGLCLLLRRDLIGAERAFVRAAAASPADARPRANLALVLALTGRDDEALAIWEQLLSPAQAAANLELVIAARPH